jgi:hypothetical protein
MQFWEKYNRLQVLAQLPTNIQVQLHLTAFFKNIELIYIYYSIFVIKKKIFLYYNQY